MSPTNCEPHLYVEPGAEELPKGAWMPPEVYGPAMANLILVCTDAMIVNRASKTVWLARRISKPASGFLYNIGGTLHRGKDARTGMAESFFRETTLCVHHERFIFVDMVRYWWKDRAQKPEDVGSDNLAYTYFVELQEVERQFVATHLEPNEYDVNFGLRAFTRADLVREKVHPVILDIYDKIFSN